jgi:uncharacterized membrane protein
MFDTVLLLVGPWLGFRVLGAVGVRRFADWRTSGAHALATMLLFTGTAHFLPDSVSAMPSHADLTAMVPPFVPFPDLMVYTSGVLEYLGALGLVISLTRAATGIGLAVLFILMLPANIYAAAEHVPLNGDPATPLWFRVPEQALFITIALWSTRPSRRPPIPERQTGRTATTSGGPPGH